MMTGLMTAFALVSGVVGARATGRGMDVDVSLFDTALHNLSYLATWYLNGGHVQGREPRGSHPSLTPSQLYRTQDGWIFLMCNKEKFWPALVEALGHPEWAEDARFASFKARLANRELVTQILDQALSQKTTAEWLTLFGGSVPAAPVFDVAQALQNPFAQEQAAIADFTRREGGDPVRMLIGPVRVAGARPPSIAAPALGADTNDILKKRLGLGTEEIKKLREKGTIT
jgi:crotonobetainyl-CoA:carnitine CoA-transferase CaiB-like acyl-CoA transferase